MNNNINLSNIDELINKVDDQIKQVESPESNSESRMDAFTRIVKGVAKKYASQWIDQDDLEQELWVKTLELIADAGGEEHLDPNLVAKACYRVAVDYYRYCRRRYDANVEYIAETGDDDASSTVDYAKLYKTHGIVKDTDYTFFREVIDLFEVGSKERKYAIMKLYDYGELDPEVFDEEVELPTVGTAKNGDFKEVDYLALLGYNPRRIAGSWIGKKNCMRAVIDRYLGK